MKYFKNTELAKLHHVSEKSIRNWIDAAQAGKLNLQLFDNNGKHFIANTAKNTRTIENLVEKGKKYKNTRGLKTTSPSPQFYEFYSQQQTTDIIAHLADRKEIPFQYTYFDGGAEHWDDYTNRLMKEQTPNILNQTVDLLERGMGNLTNLVPKGRKINIVDLGPGNGLPVRRLLSQLLEQGSLHRYIAIDSSQEMLDILEKNITGWFKGKVQYEGYVRDFSYVRFDDILAKDYIGEEADIPINIVLVLGGTLNNFKQPEYSLQTINQSLRLGDLVVYTGWLDTVNARRYFDFALGPNQRLRVEILFDLLGLDKSLYEYELTFINEERTRYGFLCPKVDISLRFNLEKGAQYVELHKNERILVWRHWHKRAIEMVNLFDENDFELVQATKSPDEQYLMLISRVNPRTS
jgi:uncharacterized SAM-dependent methyltransferase